MGIFVGAVLTVVFAGMLWLSTGLGLAHLAAILRGGPARMNVDQPTVVRQIQQLKRLETVSYTMDKIISGEHSSTYLPKFLAGDRLLLMVHGEVVGGIDLASLGSGDVLIKGQRISIHLPAAEVFSTRIDNAKTKVYSRDTGLFSSADPNLESEVREEAERQLQQAALQDGILKTAGDNARTTISSMLQGFGFREVEIR
jgi:DMSO/TMAO reductase YedYZ molybdopterin-dependent catalytic subunit